MLRFCHTLTLHKHVVSGRVSLGLSRAYQTSSSQPYLIRSSSLILSASAALVAASGVHIALTFNFVLADVDERGRRDRVAREIVHHLFEALLRGDYDGTRGLGERWMLR